MSTSTTARTRHERRAAADERARAAARRRGLLFMTGGAVGIGLLVVGIAFLSGLGRAPELPAVSASSVVFPNVPLSGRAIGAATAPVTLEVYEDFQCPACRQWTATVLPGLVQQEVAAGKLRIVARDMAFIGAESTLAARAAWGAEQQGRFWDYDVGLYRMQGAENSGIYTEASLTKLATDLGLNLTTFQRDLAGSASLTAVQDSGNAAKKLGINSTPTVLLNGKRQADSSLDGLRSAIAALAAR